VEENIVQLNGQRAQLAPGAQIRDASNRVIVPMALPSDALVKYRLDASGQVRQVWILTPRKRRADAQALPADVRLPDERVRLGQDRRRLARQRRHGARRAPEDADLIVFNTCSVREKAQEKVFADLGRVRHLKRAKPGLMIAVGGCVASQEGAGIVERSPFVDVVFGPQTLHRLPQAPRAAPRHGPAAGRHQLSADREVRRAARAARNR